MIINSANYGHQTERAVSTDKLLLDDIPKVQSEPNGTVISSVLNLVLSIIGAGTLAVPYAVAQSGLIMAALLFILVALINVMTLSLNMECAATLAPSSSYNALCAATIPRCKVFVDLTVFIATFGSLCAYLVVIGDLLPDAVQTIFESHAYAHFLLDRRLWIIAYLMVFIFPTVALKKMSALRYTSFLAVMCYGYIMVVIVYYALDGDDSFDKKGKIEWFPSSNHLLKIFKAIPFYVQIFSCHFNTFSICNELKQSSMRKLNAIAFFTVVCSMIIYAVIGYGAYLTFGDLINSDIITFYPKTTSMLILRLFLSISVAFGYPVIMQSTRDSASIILFGKRAKKLDNFAYYLLTYCIVFASFSIAMITSNLAQVLGIVGSTATIMIVFILPSVFYCNLPRKQDEKKSKFKMLCSVLFMILGVALIPFCVTMQFVN